MQKILNIKLDLGLRNLLGLKKSDLVIKRSGFATNNLGGSLSFLCVCRHFYPDKEGAYTFWTYMMNCRAKVGMRIFNYRYYFCVYWYCIVFH